MSQLKVNTIRHTGASSDAVTLATDGTCTAKITNIAGRNMVTNGGMGICQRDNSSATSVGGVSSAYHLDMYRLRASGSGGTGVYTAQQVEDAPAGFKHSMKLDVTTADTSLSAGSYHTFYIPIEGKDILRTSFGSSDAKALTLSFWVKSNLTGAFGGSLGNSNNNRAYAFNYSISSADTWEKKSITIPGDTTGSWFTDNRLGMKVTISLGVGSDFTGTANTWTAGELMAPTSHVNVVNSTSNYINFTGFQLETGSVATDFEWHSHQVEFSRCQRYYQEIHGGYGGGASSTSEIIYCVTYPIKMRSTPTVGQTAAMTFEEPSDSDRNQSSTSVSIRSSRCSDTGCVVALGNYSSIQKDQLYFSNCNQNSGGKVTYSAEF